MKRLIFIIVVTLYILFLAVSCTGVKHLTKTVNKVFEKKDSIGKNNSVSVSTDTSKFNTEIVIEYSDTAAMNKLIDGSEVDWQPFVVVDSDYIIMKRDGWFPHQPIKKITIKSSVSLHKKDSIVVHDEGHIKTETKTVAIAKEVHQRKTSYWWTPLLIIPALFLLYQKYKSKWHLLN